ncbi:hypothetical protein [uncultured Draconibacterium sp.]|uniref:hypothetical protein n=1 Tax=uncultured Draconibacterium sp. TaxID=1573823 RepID=UPI003217BC10
MFKIIIFVLVFWFPIHGSSQNTNTFSLGGGTEHVHNSYLSPYNLKGTRFIDARFSRDKAIEKSKWKSEWNVEFGVSSLNIDFDFTNLQENGPLNVAIELSADKKYLYNLLDMNKLSIYAGGIAALQSRYQIISFFGMNLEAKSYTYFMCGGSAGISTSVNFRLKKVNIQNSSSCLLINAMSLPNNSNDLPFSSNMITRYLTFSTINSTIHLNNELKIQFPLFYKNRLINSYSLSYTINYENFETKAVLYKNLSHIFTLGLIFTTQRMNILSP